MSGDRWAVLVTGSRGYDNYRHHADVAHVYHHLRRSGMQRDHIIVLQYGDVATNTENPYPGQLFNRATGAAKGIDVNADLVPDFSNSSVTKETFVDVMLGNGSHSGLKSGPNDDVMVWWQGHGGSGYLLLPDGSSAKSLYAEQLMQTLREMHSKGRYGRLLFVLGACQSGSMFDGRSSALQEIGVFAVTAAAANEDSYPTYCCNFFRKPGCNVGGKDVGSCLGDLFSVGWLEFLDGMSSKSLLRDVVDKARSRAAPNGGNPGSNVQLYGNLSLQSESAQTFFGVQSMSSLLMV